MSVNSALFGRGDFLPHGYCFAWSPGLLWSLVAADTLIALAYFSIPLAILVFIRKRADPTLDWLAWLFCAFIFACGITHALDVWTIWRPDYDLQAVAKACTAAISLVTAAALWPLIPRALRIPSVTSLQSVIESLRTEVAARRRVEEELGDLQQNLTMTLASIEAGFIAVDRGGMITQMNAVAERATGWPESEARGHSYWEVFVREGRPADLLSKNPVDLLLERDGDPHDPNQIVVISRGGVRTPIEFKAAVTRGEDGGLRGLALVFRDMSRVIRAESDSLRLAAIVDSSTDAIIGKTLEGRITSWNNGAERLFGYTAAEAIGQPVQMLIPPEKELEEMRILANVWRGNPVAPFETVRRAKDGTLIDVSLSISPVRDIQGRVIGASKIARDITAQKRSARALQDSEERLRFTLESSQIGDFDLDMPSGVGRRSALYARLMGYAEMPEDWGLESFLRHIHPDDRDATAAKITNFRSQAQDWQFECRMIWPDGSVHWISVHGSTIASAGRPVRMLGIVADVTQRRLDEEIRTKALQLEAENKQIQEASRLKSQFLANMSHELRTPLNAIIGFADLLHTGAVPKESPKLHEFLGYISSSGRHLLKLINDVLDLSKVESGKFEFFPAPLDLRDLVKDVTDILHTDLHRKQLRLAVEIDPQVQKLQLDPARLKQVLFNYLSNAIKFTPPGGNITVRARAEGPEHFRLEVEDNGIGIAAGDIPRLFNEFTQLDTGYDKHHPGTGLGLALTRRLVEAQGGRVGVSSVLGSGSVFHLVLNRRHGGDLAAAVGVQDEHSRKRRLLLIEEDRLNQKKFSEALASAGFTVDEARTGEQAVVKAADQAYDAIALNLEMPDEAGLSALARIRSRGSSRESPVVGMSMGEGADAASFAIADVLSKPIHSAEIAAAMSNLPPTRGRRKKVLVVDDDPVALDLMRAVLVALGIEALCVQDGHTALRGLDESRPDAIILDLLMPEFDGFEFLDSLRGMPAWRTTPVFIWTNMTISEPDYVRLAKSAHYILTKGGGEFAAVLEELRRRYPPLGDRHGRLP